MTGEIAAWWAIRRGPLAFAIRMEREPRCVPGADVWWTDTDRRWRGLVSAEHRPVGVRDVAQALNLPSAPLSDEPWVLVSDEEAGDAWALVSDTEPEVVQDAEVVDAPWLPTAVTRRLISSALGGPTGYYLVVDPADFSLVEDEAAEQVSDQRIAVRRNRIDAVREIETLSPELLVTTAGDTRWAVDSRRIHSVVRVERISPLPGGSQVVAGLATITGRVNIVVDPARVTDGKPVAAPCWVASVVSDSAKWAIASAGDWEILNTGDYEIVDDQRESAGPQGLVVQQVLHDGELISIFSVDTLADLARESDHSDSGEEAA